jgi:hypothetical protein
VCSVSAILISHACSKTCFYIHILILLITNSGNFNSKISSRVSSLVTQVLYPEDLLLYCLYRESELCSHQCDTYK